MTIDFKVEKLGNALSEVLQLQEQRGFISKASVKLEDYIIHHNTYPEKRILRDVQPTALVNLLSFLKEGKNEGYVEWATGVGKSVFAAVTIMAMEPKNTLIVVPRKQLVGQWQDLIKEYMPRSEIGKFYGEEKETGKEITITTYQSLLKGIAKHTIEPTDFEYLILDEAHKSLGNKTKAAIESFPKDTLKLGLTATPEYQEKHVSLLLPYRIHKIGIEEAARGGYISGIKAVYAYTSISIENIHITADGDYDRKELDEKIDVRKLKESAFELYTHPDFKIGKEDLCIINCVSVKHAQEMAGFFNEQGVRAEAIWGGMDKNKRKQAMEDFNSGREIRVLTQVDTINEGYDNYKVSRMINARPTMSKVLVLQRGGRSTRKNPMNPYKIAIVGDLMFEFQDPARRQLSFAEAIGNAIILPDNWPPEIKKYAENIMGFMLRDVSEKQKAGVNILGSIKVVSNPVTINEIIAKAEKQRYNDAPKGWTPVQDLVKSKRISHRDATIYIRKYSEDKEILGMYLLAARKNIAVMHASPEFMEIALREKAGAPDTYVSFSYVAKYLGITHVAFKTFLQENGLIKFFEKFGKKGLYMNRENIPVIKMGVEDLTVKKGELSMRAIARNYGVGGRSGLKTWIEKSIGKDAVVFRKFGNRAGYYIRAEKVKEVKEGIKKLTVKKGEISIQAIAGTGSNVSLKPAIEKEFGKEVVVFRKFGGGAGYYIKAESINEIMKWKEELTVKEGEISVLTIVKSAGMKSTSNSRVRAMMEKEMGTGVIVFRRFGGNAGYYIRSERVEEVKKWREELTVKEGEISISEIARICGVGGKSKLKAGIEKRIGKDSVVFRKFGKVEGYYVKLEKIEEIKKWIEELTVKKGEMSIREIGRICGVGDSRLRTRIERKVGNDAVVFRKFGNRAGFYVKAEIVEEVKKWLIEIHKK